VDVIKDEKTGEILELHCTYDPETRGGDAPDGRKVKSTLHWVSAPHAVDAEVRLYDRLFITPNPDNTEEGKDYFSNLNTNSLKVLNDCKVETSLKNAKPGDIYQFERQGYFCVDIDSDDVKIKFNRTVALRDTWAKINQAMQKEKKNT
jgi:glutaminyl-tRNA synthetase